MSSETKLINFNIPINLAERVDYMTNIKGISRTSLLVSFLENWVRTEEKAIIDDAASFEAVKKFMEHIYG